ncbi:MAG TPA: VCBS repeat-containing protein [Myxococcota bacterium]|jgi:hypothetical protein|nr:VCBS repeat-containing protein [Myxococcota bacterium]
MTKTCARGIGGAALLAAGLAAAAAGCHRHSVIVVEVTPSVGYDGAGIAQLVATFSLAGQDDDMEAFPAMPGAPITFPASFAVSLRGSLDGDVTVAISARDAAGNELATGATTAAIDRHHSTTAGVTIAPFCGNGVADVVLAEACDQGAANSDTTPDACRTDCTPARCSDGVTDSSEECDDGAANSNAMPDACRVACVLPACGDAVVDSGEACDAGAANDDTAPDACRTTCAAAGCGDGVTDTGESCDDGAANSDTVPDACRTTCALPTCGDGVTDMGEACDDGAANSDTAPDACRTTCVAAFCGDGVTDALAGETCDDGNALDGDQCGHACDAPPPVPATVDLGAVPSPAAWRLSAAGPVLAVGDFDGDGLGDAAFGDDAAATVRVVLGVDLPPAGSPAAVDVALAAAVSVTGAAGSALGAAVAAGDLDGDGLDDLVMGAPGETAVHVVLGATMAAATLPLALDLTAAPADVTVTLPAGDGGGAAVAAGDLNDDGLDELIIGEPGYSPSVPRTGAGRVHVIVGRAFAPLPAAIDAAAAAEMQFLGADGGDALGSTLAAGDFDGDGLDDVAAAAPGGDGAGEAYTDAGDVLLWRGRALSPGAATSVLDALAGEYELVLQGGPDPGAALGAAAALGDLDGDGRAELCAGAPLYDATAAADGPGTVACVLGTTVALGAGLARDQAAGGADVTIAVGGATAAAGLGAALATGDANNDGRADLLVGEPGSDAAFAGGGRAHLWLGRAIGAPLTADLDAVPAEATLLPEPGTAGLGAALAVGDLDGDGFADLVVAAGPAGAGVAYVVRGGTNPTP